MIDLADAWEKLRWSRHHLEILRPHIEAFEKRDSHRFSFSLDADTGEYVFYVHDLDILDPDWGLSIGDCIHNARTALDYVAVRLWARVTNVEPGDVGDVDFPIQSVHVKPNADYADIQKAFTAARDRFKASAAKFGKEPGFSGYLATIEQLQPFNRDNPSIWGLASNGFPRYAALPDALDRLSRLDNIDKHRVPHAAWASINVFGSFGIETLAPEEFQPHGGSTFYGPLENDAEVSRWRFQTPLPSDWHPAEVDMKRSFPLQVAFGEPGLFQGVLEVLEFCLWGVEAVLTIFDPVFKSGQPPLPVTAIAEPRP